MSSGRARESFFQFSSSVEENVSGGGVLRCPVLRPVWKKRNQRSRLKASDSTRWTGPDRTSTRGTRDASDFSLEPLPPFWLSSGSQKPDGTRRPVLTPPGPILKQTSHLLALNRTDVLVSARLLSRRRSPQVSPPNNQQSAASELTAAVEEL